MASSSYLSQRQVTVKSNGGLLHDKLGLPPLSGKKTFEHFKLNRPFCIYAMVYLIHCPGKYFFQDRSWKSWTFRKNLDRWQGATDKSIVNASFMKRLYTSLRQNHGFLWSSFVTWNIIISAGSYKWVAIFERLANRSAKNSTNAAREWLLCSKRLLTVQVLEVVHSMGPHCSYDQLLRCRK